MKVTLNNGVDMPVIGLGTVGLQGKDGEKSILTAIELGYRMIDTAQMYGNEKEVGNAILQSGINREELFITTKIHSPSNSYEKAKIAIEKSLENLKLDYIDLFLVHEPYSQSLEMYRALTEAYRDKKIRAIGISNFNQRRLDEFLKTCEVIPAVNQIESHVFYPQLNLKEYLKTKGIQTQAWAPLVGGNKSVEKQEILKKIGKKYNKTPSQVALRYLIQNEIIVIPKSSKKEHLKQNINIFDFELSIEDLESIKSLDSGKTLYEWTNHWQ